MSRTSLLPALLFLAACGETITYSLRQPDAPPELNARVTIEATIVAPRLTKLSDGRQLSLLGINAEPLSQLVGAEIRMTGMMDEIYRGYFWLVEFEVLAVNGLPVLDGLLIQHNYELVIRDMSGTLWPVPSVPEALARHIGRRVWIAFERDVPVRWGLL